MCVKIINHLSMNLRRFRHIKFMLMFKEILINVFNELTFLDIFLGFDSTKGSVSPGNRPDNEW